MKQKTLLYSSILVAVIIVVIISVGIVTGFSGIDPYCFRWRGEQHEY